MKKCDRKNCDGVGNWMPILEMHVKGYKGVPALVAFNLRVCDQCKAKLKVEDLVDDSGWIRLAGDFTSRGLAAPTRKLTKIRWEWSIDPKDAN